jgi:hypothetical protein
MTRFIAFGTIALSSLLLVAGSAEARCRSGGWSGWGRAPVYQPYYYYSPAPPVAGSGSTYRSFSYDPGVAQPSYQYYAPRSYSAPSSSDMWRADRKIRGSY